MRIVTIVGNRPQFVKAAAVSHRLRRRADEVLVHTGQHHDDELSRIFFDELELPRPEHRLEGGGGTNAGQTARMLAALEPLLASERPDAVLVYGDTNSTLAGAHAAGEEVPVAHVEAGLRSFDLAMPEERNRIDVDRLSALLFCPDERSAAQLELEGVPGRREVVGDVMADATRLFEPIARRLERRYDPPYTVLTIHRQANTEPDRLRAIVEAINVAERSFVFPVHPRTRYALGLHGLRLAGHVEAIEPLGYLELLALVTAAEAVVTDSGGLQKEAYWLRVPCVTLRPSTEWVDTVIAGANRLAEPDELAAALNDARFPPGAPPLYGDGHASERIAAALYA
jgi:UDP-N-acetylglucosamine 2-epimerase (non-hydrolysing)/UDP-GlcNAc3NAcA epimerase